MREMKKLFPAMLFVLLTNSNIVKAYSSEEEYSSYESEYSEYSEEYSSYDYSEVECHDDCNCDTETVCNQGLECSWDNGCREATDWEIWDKTTKACNAIGNDKTKCVDAEDYDCSWNKRSGSCFFDEDEPETCDNKCEECETEGTCSSSNAACGWDFEEEECNSCNEHCGACSEEEVCAESEESCTWENDACREKTEYEEWLADFKVCQTAGVLGCKDFKQICRYDKRTGTCATKKKEPEVCLNTCEECENSETCSSSNAACGWDNEEDECVSCDEKCGACSSEQFCGDSNEKCLWENDACREKTEYEEWLENSNACENAGDFFGCVALKHICRYDKRTGECVTKQKEPEVCLNTCEECESESTCSSSNTACGWDDEEEECISCNEHCGACLSEDVCDESKESCTWENDACREKTEYEEWDANKQKCDDAGEDFLACRLLRGICRFDKKSQSCQITAKEPERCSNSCEMCKDSTSCGASNAFCNWDGEECEDLCDRRRLQDLIPGQTRSSPSSQLRGRF